MSKILVETIIMYKMTYLVEDDNVDYAKDTVVCKTDDEYEIHQEFLGETISGSRKLSNKEYDNFLKSIDMDEEHAKQYVLHRSTHND